MKKEIMKKFPNWVNEIGEEYGEMGLCLTDDLDSLLSVAYLMQINPLYKINLFYTFSNLYGIKGTEHIKNSIGVDLDLLRGKCWGNHVVKANSNIELPLSANINNVNNITMQNYTSKYCGSTVLEIISYYNIDISHLSLLAKKLLLCIDSTFMSYGFNKRLCKKYLVEQMELEELYSILDTTPQSEFYDLKKDYKLNGKIYIKNNTIETDLNLSELSGLFGVDLTFLTGLKTDITPSMSLTNNVMYNVSKDNTYTNKDLNSVFSMAITNKSTIKYSKHK